MRVLWFCNTPANGGERVGFTPHTGGWLQALDKTVQTEVELHIAFFNPKGPRRFTVDRTTYHSIMPGSWRFRLLMKSIAHVEPDWDDLPLYREIIDEVEPDIVHIHGTESGYIRLVHETKQPVIVSLQGIVSYIQRKMTAGMSEVTLRKIVTTPGLCRASIFPRTYSWELRNMKHRAIREYANLRAVKYIDGRTTWDRNIARILAPKARYFKVDRVLREQFYNYAWKFPDNRQLRVFSTSNPAPYKGIETIIEAYQEIKRVMPEAIWTVAGIPSEDPILKAAMRKLNWRFQVHGLRMIGRVGADEIIKEMMRSDVYVTASHAENSPNNLAEAQALGMPCVAALAGGTGTYLKDRETGIMVQDGDPWGLAGAVLEFWEDKRLAAACGSAAKTAALGRHDRMRIKDQLLSAYREVLLGNKA